MNFSNFESNFSNLVLEKEIVPPGLDESKVQPLEVVLAVEAERKRAKYLVRM